MRLKKLELQGFKSFVDKTVLKFDDGITAIVGPNGSGKSNISDAVKWVLGEQSPKSLRGGKMEDVIFSGTENKRPVGMSEVSLTIDNEDRTLNIDYSEVKITRRLYRSGESEYLINGSNCRLKDITLLFADTGIGKDGYSIIGQGKVDEILSTRSSDRRAIFEDASGIMKYRMQKEESERKLNHTEQNLVRISDILAELERQIGPLTRQSEKAKKYLQLKYELRDIEVGALVEGIDESDLSIDSLNHKLDIASKDIKETDKKLENIKAENQEKTEKSKSLEEEISRKRESTYELNSSIERIGSNIKINENNINTFTQAIKRYSDELIELNDRKVKIASKLKELDHNLIEAKSQEGLLQEKLNEMQEKYNSIMSLLSSDSAQAEEIKDSIYEAKLLLSQKSQESENAKSNISRIKEEEASLKAEIEKINESITSVKDKLKQSKESYDKLSKESEDLKDKFESESKELNSYRYESDKTREKIASYEANINATKARLKLMQEMQDNYEGYARGVKEILKLCKTNPDFGRGIYGSVAEIMEVPKEYELAIETAIGYAFQNIVTESEDEAKKAIDYLKRMNFGRATFLPITAVRGRTIEDKLERELEKTPGFVGLSSKLIKFDKKFINIIDNLLGRVVIFDNLDNGIKAAKRYNYSFVAVTLEGDILRTSGAMTGGSTGRDNNSSVFTRVREIPQLEKDLKALNEGHEKESAKLLEFARKIKALEEGQSKQIKEIQALEIERERSKNSLDSLEDRESDISLRHSSLIASLNKGIDLVKELESLIANNLGLEKATRLEITKLQDQLTSYEEKSSQGAEVRQVLTDELTSQQIKISEVRNRRQNYIDEKARLEEENRDILDKEEYLNLQVKEDKQTIEKLRADNASFLKSIEDQGKDVSDTKLVLDRITQEKLELDASLSGIIEIISDVSKDLSNYREEYNRLNFQKEKALENKEYCQNRLWEEYELTYTRAREISEKGQKIDRKVRNDRISELRQAMRALGNVNVAAIEELEETSKRFEFLSGQYNDMHLAKTKLLKVIADMNKVMQEQFTSQLAIIRENFETVFMELFGGGSADIVLTDDANVLESGIEIRVQPPGKKLQNMLLLSGGEKALTAIALLFAILKLRPAPFCLLDEIEASLDEANIYKLGRYVQKEAGDTQFVMVTHRKGTMEIAKTLYGVTMEEKGISKVVSMKLGGE